MYLWDRRTLIIGGTLRPTLKGLFVCEKNIKGAYIALHGNSAPGSPAVWSQFYLPPDTSESATPLLCADLFVIVARKAMIFWPRACDGIINFHWLPVGQYSPTPSFQETGYCCTPLLLKLGHALQHTLTVPRALWSIDGLVQGAVIAARRYDTRYSWSM